MLHIGGFLFLSMNYLAHIYLSGDDEDVMIGNFMADGVKGKSFFDYSEGIKKGILLHRFIDDYTDTHPTVLETKVLFRPIYHKLSPILVDMLYDHYLAKYWSEYHAKPLRKFVDEVYSTLQKRSKELTPRVQHMLPYMIQYDWLYNYQFQEGMERVLNGMSRRVPSGKVLARGWQDLQPFYHEVKQQFQAFFSDLITESQRKLKELN
jgi:acyl carrier protein phosphodiesterase